MRWGMVIDLTKCTRCHGCVAACRVEHFLPLWVTWVKLAAYETEERGAADITTFPVRCNQCADAPCVDVCPTGATSQRKDGIVTIDANKCIGCRYCVIACPYQNRTFIFSWRDPGYFPGYPKTRYEKKGEELYPHQKGTTTKCNFCVEKIDYGLANGLTPGIDRDATPACVNTCQARALTFGDIDDPNSNVSRLIARKNAFQLQRVLGTDPSIYYIDGEVGGKDNKAPEHAMTGIHIQQKSTVDPRSKRLIEEGRKEEE